MWGEQPEKPKVHGATWQWPGLLMPTHDADPIDMPGSDGNHVSESLGGILLTSLEMDCGKLDTPSLTQWSKGENHHQPLL